FPGNTIYTSVCFTGLQTGWICGTDGILKKTTNGGTDWVTIPTGLTTPLSKVFFRDAQNGWVAGLGGKVLRTTDGGTTWTPQPVPTSVWLNAVYSTGPTNGYVVGEGETIIGIGIPLTTVKSLLADPEWSLFPNPAEQSFQIDLQEPIFAITCVDIQGRKQTCSLSSDRKIDVSQWEKGLYWIQIQTKSGFSVKKFWKQ
ncbi:MAG TPA: T9SS type A sorting domain-containing protein, partial [Catalimonadaceae bacterium]|nr:T9SS type A sorting domain-containing protein [Catalimonadaceae bacterium]